MPYGPTSVELSEPGDEDARLKERQALDDLFSLVYEELRKIASCIRRDDPSQTMNSTALVHEAFLKLRNSPKLAATSPGHFKAIAARAMRQVLVDAARKRISHKRGGAGNVIFVPLDESAERAATSDQELLWLDSDLNKLARLNLRQANVIEFRFFGGMNVAEAASELGVSESVVERDWRAAKAWLMSSNRSGAQQIHNG